MKASALVISRYIKAIEVDVSAKEDVAITVLLNVYCDLKLAELTVQQIIVEKLQNHFNCASGEANNGTTSSSSIISLPASVSDFFKEFQWQGARDYVENRVVQLTVSQCSASISLVTEVPRLYRRTNRDLPTKHGDYVEGILQPISALKSIVITSHQGQLWEGIGYKISSEVTSRYVFKFLWKIFSEVVVPKYSMCGVWFQVQVTGRRGANFSITNGRKLEEAKKG